MIYSVAKSTDGKDLGHQFEGTTIAEIIALVEEHYPDKKVDKTLTGTIYVKCSNYTLVLKKIK